MSDLARQVVEGFGPNWTAAEVAHVYPNDITRVRLNIRGQRGDAILGNTQWVLHEGDWVIAFGPHPKSRLWLILGYLGSVNPGDWFTGDGGAAPDLTSGQGPIPGFRPPLDFDSLWRDLGAETAPEALIGHHLAPRPGDEADARVSGRIRVYGGYTAEALESYGDLIIPRDRLRIMRQLPVVTDPGGWCTTGETNDSGVTFLSGAYIGHRPWPGGPYFVGGGICDNAAPDLTTMYLGSNLARTHEDGFSVHLTLLAGAEAGELFYFKFAPFLPDKQFIIRYLGGGSVAVGWTTAILTGTPPYPSAGNWATFSLPPVQLFAKEIRNRKGEARGQLNFNYYEFTIGYRGNEDGTSTVSIDYNNQSHDIGSWIWGGQLMQDWQGYAGNLEGFLIGSLDVSAGDVDRRFLYGASQAPIFPRGLPGEVAWHAHAYMEDPIDPADPDGPAYASDVGDLLGDGLYLCILEDKWVQIAGTSTKTNSDEDWQGADFEGSSTPIYPDLDQLGGLDEDVLPQYHNDDRATEWLGTRSTDDLPASATQGYVAPAERDSWTAAAAPGGAGGDTPPIDVSAQIDGVRPDFVTPATFQAGSLRVTLNSLPLRNGIDFVERPDRQGFAIGLRTPIAGPPADVLLVGYRTE